jgi:hypothetical protein
MTERDERGDVTIQILPERLAEAKEPSIATSRRWQSDALTLFGVLFGTLTAIVGVVIASWPWQWRAGYAVLFGSLTALWLSRPYRVIGWMRRYLDWVARLRVVAGPDLSGEVKPSGDLKVEVDPRR